MKEGYKKYLDIIFIVFVFVITSAFFKEYVFRSSSMLIAGLSGLIGVVVGMLLLRLVKKRGVLLKTLILVGYILVVFLIIKIFDRKGVESIKEVNDFSGVWEVNEDSLRLQLEILENNQLYLSFFPDSVQLIYEWKRHNNQIDFYEEEVYSFSWQVLKLSADSLVVREGEQILEFTSSSDNADS